MGYKKCYDCGRVFKTTSLLDKMLRKENIDIYCPKCGGKEIYSITKKMYQEDKKK